MLFIFGLPKNSKELGEFCSGFINRSIERCQRIAEKKQAICTKASAAMAQEQLKDCDPLSEHLKQESFPKVKDAIAKGEISKALKTVDANSFNKKDMCILALKVAITCFPKQGYKVIKDATWNLLGG